MNYLSFAGILICITYFVIACLTYVNRKTKLHYIWTFFNISVGMWGLGALFISLSKDYNSAYLSWKFAHFGIITIPIFFFHTVYIFCELKKRWLLHLVYFQGIIFLILDVTGFLFAKNLVYSFDSFYYIESTPFYSLFLLIWFVLVLYGHYELAISFQQASRIKKVQISYFFLGTLLGFGGGLLNFPEVYKIHIYPFGNYFLPIYPIIVTYAIFRYRLMDVRLVVTRSGIFLAVYSLILGTPLLIIYFLQNELVKFLKLSWWIVPFLFSTALATLGPFLYVYFDRKIEQRLLSEQKKYQDILKSASRGMIRIRKLDLLLRLVVYVVKKIVHIKHASIFLVDEFKLGYNLKAKRVSKGVSINVGHLDVLSPLIQILLSKHEPIITEETVMKFRDDASNSDLAGLVEQLIGLGAALVIPSFIEDKLVGILVLGEKRSGKLYTQDDLTVFSVLANQAALAIENAQFYEEIRKTQESLFQAEKMATICTMADGLSHQINNRFHALSLIAGDSMDVLKTYDYSQCSEETRQIFNDLKNSLERIQANVLQGGEVVKGLLKYSRPGQGGFERVNFKDVLDGAVEMVSYKIKLREIDLVKDIATGLPCLNTNIVQLQEVFFNLIDNAYDAIKERQMILNEEDYRGRIEISVMADQGALHINVQDNGIGIKSDDKRKVFTPFFTTKATSKKGTGLGLYVIQKIIAAHNGQIRINSVYRSGTCFTVSLPIKPTLAAA